MASSPEELEQLEPEGGEWQLEYYGEIGSGSGDEHSVQALYGFSESLAAGLELEGATEAGAFELEGLAPTVLIRFSDAEAEPFGLGLGIQAEFGDRLALNGLEARLIAERRTADWWAQANAIFRHEREDGASATGLAYAWGISRSIEEAIWFGLEGSGQAARLAGSKDVFSDGNHFAGPALTVEPDLKCGCEVELGLAWLRRVAGDGPRDTARLFVQIGF